MIVILLSIVISVILIQFDLNVLLKIVIKDIGRGGRQLLPQEQQYQNTNLLLLILLLFWNYLCCKILLVVLCNNSSPKKQQYQYYLRSRKDSGKFVLTIAYGGGAGLKVGSQVGDSYHKFFQHLLQVLRLEILTPINMYLRIQNFLVIIFYQLLFNLLSNL